VLSRILSGDRFPPRIKSGAGFIGIMLAANESARRERRALSEGNLGDD